MSEMIERVARALAERALRKYAGGRGEDAEYARWVRERPAELQRMLTSTWPSHVEDARAAIEAMRRPVGHVESDRISRAIGLAMEREGLANISIGSTWAVWEAMIDAALTTSGT